MTDNTAAATIAASFKNRLEAGDVLRDYEEYEPQDDDSTSLYAYAAQAGANPDGLREICVKVLELLGGKGARDDQSGFYVKGVWARFFVGTDEGPDEKIRFILEMTRKQP